MAYYDSTPEVAPKRRYNIPAIAIAPWQNTTVAVSHWRYPTMSTLPAYCSYGTALNEGAYWRAVCPREDVAAMEERVEKAAELAKSEEIAREKALGVLIVSPGMADLAGDSVAELALPEGDRDVASKKEAIEVKEDVDGQLGEEKAKQPEETDIQTTEAYEKAILGHDQPISEAVMNIRISGPDDSGTFAGLKPEAPEPPDSALSIPPMPEAYDPDEILYIIDEGHGSVVSEHSRSPSPSKSVSFSPNVQKPVVGATKKKSSRGNGDRKSKSRPAAKSKTGAAVVEDDIVLIGTAASAANLLEVVEISAASEETHVMVESAEAVLPSEQTIDEVPAATSALVGAEIVEEIDREPLPPLSVTADQESAEDESEAESDIVQIIDMKHKEEVVMPLSILKGSSKAKSSMKARGSAGQLLQAQEDGQGNQIVAPAEAMPPPPPRLPLAESTYKPSGSSSKEKLFQRPRGWVRPAKDRRNSTASTSEKQKSAFKDSQITEIPTSRQRKGSKASKEKTMLVRDRSHGDGGLMLQKTM